MGDDRREPERTAISTRATHQPQRSHGIWGSLCSIPGHTGRRQCSAPATCARTIGTASVECGDVTENQTQQQHLSVLCVKNIKSRLLLQFVTDYRRQTLPWHGGCCFQVANMEGAKLLGPTLLNHIVQTACYDTK